MEILLPAPVLTVLNRLTDAGFAAYVVGGCVRDSLLGMQPLDWDITTSATPQQVVDMFGMENTVPTGIKFGTVTVLQGDMDLQLTTFRADLEYTDHRRPCGVVFGASLAEDLARRDFTVNAMAYRPGELVDLYGGEADLRFGVLRAVGEPKNRFEEDALRILRGLRFAAVLGFDIEPQTAQAMRQAAPQLRHISVERVYAEITKLICGGQAGKVFTEFRKIIAVVMPELTDPVIKPLTLLPANPEFRWAALCFNTKSETVTALLKRLRAAKPLIRRVNELRACGFALLSKSRDNRGRASMLLRTLGPDYADAIILARAFDANNQRDTFFNDVEKTANNILQRGGGYSLETLAVTGGDCGDIGLCGKRVGLALQEALEAVSSGRVPNNKERLLGFIQGRYWKHSIPAEEPACADSAHDDSQ
ncbi:MAG: polynucleotide adenylyltransferase [Clostridia bacterium]|nr:polynucleotide adenylyltransferase [Clostridia bacterium]